MIAEKKSIHGAKEREKDQSIAKWANDAKIEWSKNNNVPWNAHEIISLWLSRVTHRIGTLLFISMGPLFFKPAVVLALPLSKCACLFSTVKIVCCHSNSPHTHKHQIHITKYVQTTDMTNISATAIKYHSWEVINFNARKPNGKRFTVRHWCCLFCAIFFLLSTTSFRRFCFLKIKINTP